MPTTASLVLFGVAALSLLLIPGPVVLFTIARSIQHGRSSGLISVLAAGLGDLVHVLAATLGLSAILLSSAVAFNLVKYAGACYLIYLGVRALLAKPRPQAAPAVSSASPRRIFFQGLMVSALNPKTALFFMAFLPQFVAPARGSAPQQVLILGLVFVGLGVLTNSLYALAAGTARDRLVANRRFLRAQSRISGLIYIGLGITTALAGRGSGK